MENEKMLKSLWYDICFYDVNKDKIVLERYLDWLSYRYNMNIDELKELIEKTRKVIENEIAEYKSLTECIPFAARPKSTWEIMRDDIMISQMQEEVDARNANKEMNNSKITTKCIIPSYEEDIIKINNFYKPRIYRKR